MIKTPVVDYRKFRLSKLNQPEYSHLKLLGGWIGYFILYFLTENFIPAERFHEVRCPLDDLIPFNEYFLIAYCFWYALIVISLGYFLLYDIDSFKRLQIYIIITQAVAMVIYIIWPSVQYLRPEVFPRDNFLTDLARFIYAFDTPTGVCPSLHVAYSMGIASAWLKYRPASRRWKCFVAIAVVIICISTAFVKQHSVVDIAAAIPLGLLAEVLVYGKSYWLPRFRKRTGV
ncbi:MAG: phosphatidic acid phosphatase [Lachnospiraceae bacterium]|nr:phosphatidic acid phosphatase [Lachnospiraceae bacterium]MBQ6469494.1 phosphatidic acid phosphatase [Lachnospiraceae bacterium]